PPRGACRGTRPGCPVASLSPYAFPSSFPPLAAATHINADDPADIERPPASQDRSCTGTASVGGWALERVALDTAAAVLLQQFARTTRRVSAIWQSSGAS